MNKFELDFENISVAGHLVKWTVLVIPIGIAVGSAVALFLWLLETVTTLRMEHEWLLFLLPIGGLLSAFIYDKVGKSVVSGNNLIIEQIHQPGGGVPRRMAPLILGSTLLTHLLGGSAGREGTAVQMGGSIASVLGNLFRLEPLDLRIVLMAGVAAGFGAVFGTPIAGTIFAMEVLTIGRIQYDAFVPCLIAALIGNITCLAWGIKHTPYVVTYVPSGQNLFLNTDFQLLAKVILCGIVFGLASLLFIQTEVKIREYSKTFIKSTYLTHLIGAIIIVGLVFILNSHDYIGIGDRALNANSVTIFSCFHPGGATYWSWLWKLLFTAITLGVGFKGGEVTPLFFIGAALGNTLAILMGGPVDLFASLGFIAVFAGAANTPLACTIMGIELFGSQYLLYFAIVCFGAYFFSGKRGIYSSQRMVIPKLFES